jgi:hypothetical protein
VRAGLERLARQQRRHQRHRRQRVTGLVGGERQFLGAMTAPAILARQGKAEPAPGGQRLPQPAIEGDRAGIGERAQCRRRRVAFEHGCKLRGQSRLRGRVGEFHARSS